MTTAKIILRELSRNETYCRKVLAFIDADYFTEIPDKILFKLINAFINKYNALPSQESLQLLIQDLKIKDTIFKELSETIDNFYTQALEPNLTWLIETSEKFCKDAAIYNALTKAIEIQNGEGKESPDAIPEILKEALSVSFDTSIGHDYFVNAEERHDWYNQKIDKIPFSLDILNKVTGGGIERKTLNCVAGTTGSGKSMLMCFLAASYLKMGYNVLYITLELSEEKIAQRIDANLMNIPLADIKSQSKPSFIRQIKSIQEKTQGQLKIKEYATASAHAGHFRHLLNELDMKKKFRADIIFVDYLSICASSRLKKSSDSFGYVKSIAEELRGLAVEKNVGIWTGTQFNRNGHSSDPEMTDTAESMGLPNTLDFYIAAIRTEELDAERKILFKQLKSRYEDINNYKKFILGVDISRMNYFEDDSYTPQETRQEPEQSVFGKSRRIPQGNLVF